MSAGPVRDVQPTFAGGEFTPALYGRTDIQKYKSGAKTLRNFTVLPQGGTRNRSGTKYIATAKNLGEKVCLIPFVASTDAAYMIELGNFYMRFYTLDSQVQVSGITAWNSGTAYSIGDLASLAGVIYYCLAANTNQTPPNATFWYPLTTTATPGTSIYEIKTPYAIADVFNIKFAQSADVLYLAHPNYVPQQLTFFSSAKWTLAAYPFTNGPFMAQNSDTSFTLTPSALSGSVTLTASKNLFFAGHVGALFQLISTIVGKTITPAITKATQDWCTTGTGASSYSVTITGTWTGTILIQTSSDFLNWTTVQTVSANGTYTGNTGFATVGFFRAIMQSGLPWSGTASVVLNGVGTSTGAITLSALNATTGNAAAGSRAVVTITSIGAGQTIVLEESDDGGNTWSTLASYTTNQAGTIVSTTKNPCLVRGRCSVLGAGGAVVTIDGTTGTAPTLSYTISSASVSQGIQCGQTWSVITTGSWTGKLRLEISTDGGNNWQLVQTFQSGGSDNFNETGNTGVAQCLLRLSSDPSSSWSGTATIDLTASTFDWTGVVLITAYTSPTQVTGTVQQLSNTDSTGLANLSSTWQWSEGAWSSFRGYPGTVAFYQDRAAWGGPQPANMNLSKTASYADFGVSSPIVDTDAINIVLSARTLNDILNLVPMPQALISLTSDSEFGVAPGANGDLSPFSVSQSLFSHRGSASVEPVVVGNEIILVQQMGTYIRNFIFQLAVQGFMGDAISLQSQHLFTGFSISKMAYQQEPDSIIWAVRSDGTLLSCTYIREQELQAWTRNDTLGSFESVAVIPNSTLGINEIWVTVKRNINGTQTRFIEVLKPRDQGTDPKQQWFLDAATQYSGAPATTISGLDYLNGMKVGVLADGFVVANPNRPTSGPQGLATMTVSGGQITLPQAASIVTVGLPYTPDIALLDPEVPNQEGPVQGKRTKIPRAKMRFWNTRGGWISTTAPVDDSITGFDEIDDIMARDPSTNMDTPLPLKTGICDVTVPSGYEYEETVYFRQVDPLPVTVLSIVPEVVIGGD